MISLSVVSSISEITPSEWDACALDSSHPQSYNPFLMHGFLSSLEDTGCATRVRSHIITFSHSFIFWYYKHIIYLFFLPRKQVGCRYTLLQKMNLVMFWEFLLFISKGFLFKNFLLVGILFPSITVFFSCVVSQPLVRWICFWSLLGWCIPKFWWKILS